MLWLPLAVLSCYAIAWVASTDQPHIVLVLVDDQGYDERSSHNPDFRTPTMDRLASQGVVLDYMYTQPSCTMSRSALLTGRYPHTMGIENAFDAHDNRSLPLDTKTLPQHLKGRGYHAYMSGKWHLGMCSRNMMPTRRGFDTFSGCLHGNSDHFFKFPQNPWDFWTNEKLDHSVKKQYDTEVLTQRAIDAIIKHKESGTDEPMFVYLAYKAIHSPIKVPAYLSNRCSHIKNTLLRDRCGTMAGVDDGIRNLTDTLERLGYMDSLLLIVMSDNGGASPEGASNWPLRGKKATPFEGGTRVPAFMYSKTLLPDSPRVYNGLIHITDIPVTIVSMASNSSTPVDMPNVDGIDQWQAIRTNGPSKRTRMVYEMWEDEASVRVGQHKLVYHKKGPCSGWYNPPSGVKTTLPQEVADCTGFMMFDLKADPNEERDLSKDPQYAEQMNILMDYFNTEKARRIPAQVSAINPNMPGAGEDWEPGWCDKI